MTSYFTHRPQHHGSGVDRRQPGSQTVDGVLVDTVGHIEHDNADECEVEEGRGPRGRLDHGQHDGDDQDYDLYEHRPHNPWRQVITDRENPLQVWTGLTSCLACSYLSL